ncbi:MAG: N-6 DNA methylase [Spirochaetaceae bacterium]|jgi:type I restriction enzyme M protein|nr:N-6 DNA methylase [Spirochaetaceae bacterium]
MDSDFIKRKSILEDIDYNKTKNLFCELSLLTNESSVEKLFVDKLLADLGYSDRSIKTKESIEKFIISTGSKKINYRPDYVIVSGQTPLLVVEAKSPKENIDNHIEQCAHYCLLLNRKKQTVRFFLVSNGLKTKLYEWDKGIPFMEMDFKDFYSGSTKYEKLHSLLSKNSLKGKDKNSGEMNSLVELKKINKENAQRIFKNCHKYIWNTEKRGVNSAFIEFVKLVFLKLWNDRRLHSEYQQETPDSNLVVPKSANAFSENWIATREAIGSMNPINDSQFKELMEHLEDDIYKRKKKPLFDRDEGINLKSTTIKGVVKKLEEYDLFGIDEDLNGRLFETFLNATMRGSSLGQYFTPRSIVLLGTLLADLTITENHIDKVLDACCGTGGFLIEALTIMRNKVRANQSYSNEIKNDLIEKLSSDYLFGVDAAKDPKLARIARINMYLHGDGGSHIYLGDSLEKTIQIDPTDAMEVRHETEEMKEYFVSGSFDVVLTNPPFSMWYEDSNEAQKKILKEYDLGKIDEATSKRRSRLRGSAMFLERYRDLLISGGKLISIIDETILSSPDYAYVRDFIRANFIIRSIISLHGDAFQQSNARVKTALIFLEKKTTNTETQPAVFMYSSIYLGVDDLPMSTKPSKVEEARKLASWEIETILDAFKRYKNGESGEWLVSADKLKDRLDVKHCLPLFGRFVSKWEKDGAEVFPLYELCSPRDEIIEPVKDFPDEEFRIMTITYTGRCKTDETRLGKEINFKKMKVVRTGDIVFSDLNAFHGAIGYITEEFDGALASGSYTVLKCYNDGDSLYLWSILRTTEIRADFLSSAIGMGRQTINWEYIKKVSIPFLPKPERKEIVKKILEAWELEDKAKKSLEAINDLLNTHFDVESDQSKQRFISTKPPR